MQTFLHCENVLNEFACDLEYFRHGGRFVDNVEAVSRQLKSLHLGLVEESNGNDMGVVPRRGTRALLAASGSPGHPDRGCLGPPGNDH